MTSTVQKWLCKSIDCVLGIRTQDRRMVGPDESTEAWLDIVFVFFLLSVASLFPIETSVTRRQCYYSIFGQLQQWKFAQWQKNAKMVQKFAKYYISHQKIAQWLLKFCQIGEISPNLVTLAETDTLSKAEIRLRSTIDEL